MFSHGVDPKLDFTDMHHIRETYERLTRMHVYERQPYAGVSGIYSILQDHIRMLLQKEWRGEKRRSAIHGQFHICRSIHRMLEENTIQMLSASTASLVKVV